MLGQQMDLCVSYLALMQVRMGDRLTVTPDVPDGLRAHPYILKPVQSARLTQALARIQARLAALLSRSCWQIDPEVFWQVHRSVIVRVSAIAEVRKDELGRFGLSLKGRTETLPVSGSFHHRFRGM
jgi:DNA-binding LytR/AlgR family response regulator